MRKAWLGVSAILLLSAFCTTYVFFLKSGNANNKKTIVGRVRSPLGEKAYHYRKNGDAYYAKANYIEAESIYADFINKYENFDDEDVQDEVGIARLRLGYAVSKNSGYSQARKKFKEAAEKYKGTGRASPEFGAVVDAAEYQAAVCFAAEKKIKEAEQAFLEFIKNYPESPLIHAAYRRLLRLNNGKSKEIYEKTLQEAVTLQEEKIRKEIVSCGPKALAYLLKQLNKAVPDTEELTALCQTNEKGTSIENMRNALKSLGIESFAYIVNKKDFLSVSLPALWLKGDHYVVVLRTNAEKALVYDPLYKNEIPVPVKDDENVKFSAYVITLSPTNLEGK